MALTTAGKVFYGAIFVVLVPVALIVWAVSTARLVHLPVMRSFPLGASLAVMRGGVIGEANREGSCFPNREE